MGDESLGAFADFLVDGMTSLPSLRRRTVAVFHGEEGSVELFRSPAHWSREAAVIALLYTTGHYRWIRWTTPGPTAAALIEALALPPGDLPPVPEVQIDARPPVIMNLAD